MIDPLDRGFTLGDGLFETLLWDGGALRHASAHLARLAAGCAVLGLPPVDEALALARMAEAVRVAGLAQSRAAVRLTLTAGAGRRGLDRPAPPRTALLVTAAPAPPPSNPARLATSAVRRNEGSPTSRLKTLSYLDNVLARSEALGAGADEALMLNNRGEVACAAAANVYWVDAAGALKTPALDCGALAGTVRARVLAAGEVEEVRASRAALDQAQAVFLSNSLIGLRPVSELDGRSLPPWRGLAALRSRVA